MGEVCNAHNSNVPEWLKQTSNQHTQHVATHHIFHIVSSVQNPHYFHIHIVSSNVVKLKIEPQLIMVMN